MGGHQLRVLDSDTNGGAFLTATEAHNDHELIVRRADLLLHETLCSKPTLVTRDQGLQQVEKTRLKRAAYHLSRF